MALKSCRLHPRNLAWVVWFRPGSPAFLFLALYLRGLKSGFCESYFLSACVVSP